MKNIFILSLLFIISCSAPADYGFTYELINGRRHLAVTPNNLIKMYELSANSQGEIFEDLGYKHVKGPYDYILKTGEVGSDFQTIATQKVRENVLTVTWVSIEENDRLVEFRRLGAEKPHGYSPKQDIYLLKNGKKTYMAKINDVIFGKEVSITAFDI